MAFLLENYSNINTEDFIINYLLINYFSIQYINIKAQPEVVGNSSQNDTN